MPRLELLLLFVLAGSAAGVEAGRTIPINQLGAEAEKQYSGDGLSITPTATGARLRAVLQKLEAEVTCEGLWLESMEDGEKRERFRVVARTVGRQSSDARELAMSGAVVVGAEKVSFVRPGVIEEYRVGVDGVRQDFVVLVRQAGTGRLEVGLEVNGAAVAGFGEGVKLTLSGSEREIAYSRLKVTDAAGRELAARMETVGGGIQIQVDDAGAEYPVRIDPTFSDADWVSMGDVPGTDGPVYAMVTDGAGNLYIGGRFTVVKDAVASNVARWDGSQWSGLGAGVNNEVHALAFANGQLYLGGNFHNAGGQSTGCIARWDGSNWHKLGTGIPSAVTSIAVSGNVVYAGGYFSTAGGQSAARIAQWDGTNWSALGRGMNNTVSALAVSGTTLYAGGSFTQAGGQNALHVARWNGTTWTAVGAGVEEYVLELAVSGSTLYTGGIGTSPVGPVGSRVRRWNGSTWSVLGVITGSVWSLVVDGTNVYIGGYFASADGVPANNVAKWNGSSWSALAGGTSHYVYGLAMVGGSLYVGGDYAEAGGKLAANLAMWHGSDWQALGSGLGIGVNALAASATHIYAAGSPLGEQSSTSVFAWNGSAWQALGAALNQEVYTLAVSGSEVYAGGRFTGAGG